MIIKTGEQDQNHSLEWFMNTDTNILIIDKSDYDRVKFVVCAVKESFDVSF